MMLHKIHVVENLRQMCVRVCEREERREKGWKIAGLPGPIK